MFEYLAEVGELLAAVLLTIGGAALELNALGSLDQTMLAAWFAFMGAVALYAGLFVVGGGLSGKVAALASTER